MLREILTLKAPLFILLGTIGDDAHDLGLGRDLAVDGRDTAHLLYLAPDPQGGHLDQQGVSWNDGTPEFGILDTAEERDLELRSSNSRRASIAPTCAIASI